jgi:predicted O-methyltransferase YrrM
MIGRARVRDRRGFTARSTFMSDAAKRTYHDYVAELFAEEDDALRETRAEIEREGLPIIHVSPSEGKLLHILALTIGAKRILEIGTLGGYSAIWLARALPADGHLISLEIDAHHADVSRRNLARAGLAATTEVRVGPAAETLAKMHASGEPLFDLVFIDADKPGYPEYLDLAAPLTRVGGLILADNALPEAVLDPDSDHAIVRYNAAVARHPELESVIVPVMRDHTDGLAISIKRAA